MRMRTLQEAQNSLPELVEEARAGVMGLTNEAGNLVGLLAGLTDDDQDDLLVETPAFQAMLARARASIQAGRLVPGDEVLEEMKQDPELRRIPVVVMTSAASEKAFVEAYNLHANCCVSKPVDQDEYGATVQKIERFWVHVAKRPR